MWLLLWAMCLFSVFHVPLALKVGCLSNGVGCDIALVFMFLCVGLMAIFCGVASFLRVSFLLVCIFVWCGVSWLLVVFLLVQVSHFPAGADTMVVFLSCACCIFFFLFNSFIGNQNYSDSIS
jgi:hypothetical protein